MPLELAPPVAPRVQGSDVDSCATSSLTSAQALKPSRTKGLTGPHLVSVLRHKYEQAGSRWKLADVRKEMKALDGLARPEQAGWVLAKLRGANVLPKHCELLLLQGYVCALTRTGWGVCLHRAGDRTVRACVYLSAKASYLQLMRAAKKQGKAKEKGKL